jgi:serine/threonine protein kinase
MTAASDAYGVGLLLYELLTGSPPFEAVEASQWEAMHRGQAPRDLRAARPDAPPELARLLRQLLAKEPLRRPSDEELVRWLTELEIAALM